MAQPRPDALPLSFAQQRLWFLDQLEPGSAAYNIPAALRLRGPLDAEALRKTLETMVERHEALRTTFVSDGQRPGAADPRAGRVDRSRASTSSRRRCEARAHEEAAQPFDLSTGPLLRATLLRLAADDHVLLVTMHHIVSDGWSLGVLVREMMALYQAFAAGQPPPLAPLPIQYADFARGSAMALGRRARAAARLLARAPRRRPAVAAAGRPSAAAGRQPPRRDARVRAAGGRWPTACVALGREHGATLFMTLLAAFQTLLHRYTGQHDFAVGTPIANRTDEKLEGLIGFFVNTLVLRADLDGNPTFVELLGRVRQEALGGYAHQDVPFERLVEELGVERDLSRTPLFQVMFVLQNAPRRRSGARRAHVRRRCRSARRRRSST